MVERSLLLFTVVIIIMIRIIRFMCNFEIGADFPTLLRSTQIRGKGNPMEEADI